MDSYEATRVVFSRVQTMDPENASKIMGYLLIQDQGEKEMIRLAFGPETLLHSLIIKAKAHLGLSSSSSSTPPSPSPFNPISISRPNPLLTQQQQQQQQQQQPSPRLPTNAFHIPSSPWPLSGPTKPTSPSYAAVVNGTNSIAPAPSYYADSGRKVIDDYKLDEELSFLNDSSTMPYGMNTSWVDSINDNNNNTSIHNRRSNSVSEMCYWSEDTSGCGFGWKPCLYFARGYCKNGNSCKFLHSGFADGTDSSAATIVGSPSKLDGFEQEMLRSKAIQQQRFAAAASQLVAGVSFPYNKCMNFLLQHNDTQRSAAAALMMGEELHKFGRSRPERNDFLAMGLGGTVNPGSRQIYLTFPADSTFREEDVSNYFSIYGPVQDVRIPYQQKRMFGFVTFVYPETVKLILAKGNPHFVCDSRVLVKPYKEKGKIPDKKQQQQQQQLERGEFSACSSPSGFDSREPYDLQLGARMFYNNNQEMLVRRKLEEQAELQQAIELHGRRLMNLQLLDLKNHHHHNQYQHNLSPGASVPSPTQSHTHINQTLILPSDAINQGVPEENSGSPVAAISPTAAADDQLQWEVDATCNHNNGSGNSNGNGNGKEESSNFEDCDLHESFEHILPDNLFASPTKLAGDHSVFSATLAEADESTTISTTSSPSNNNPLLPATSTLNMASLKSCYFQMPRFSSGNEAIGM